MIQKIESNSDENMVYSVWGVSKGFPKEVISIMGIKGRSNMLIFICRYTMTLSAFLCFILLRPKINVAVNTRNLSLVNGQIPDM